MIDLTNYQSLNAVSLIVCVSECVFVCVCVCVCAESFRLASSCSSSVSLCGGVCARLFTCVNDWVRGCICVGILKNMYANIN